MSLRVRLVTALLALFAVGMAVYGVASHQAFARSELARLDDQVRAALPVVERELLLAAGLGPSVRPHAGGRMINGHDASPRVVIAPGTYAELRDGDGTTVAAIQAVDDQVQPDLTTIDAGLDGSGRGTVSTVPSVDGDVTWRVVVDDGPADSTVLVAVPMTSIEQALGRLLTIELVAGAGLLVVLGLGAWFVLRSGLRPLERIAATTRSITAGSLDQRVPTPIADTEVKQLATALNTMLDDLEDAFHEREATEARLRRFLSDASHELRTPLTSIQGYAELFRLGRHRDDVDLDLVMRRIEDESGHMRELVENLLALAKLDEAAPPVREPVDLTILAADACSDAAAMEPDRPIRLDAPAPVEVRGDVRHLRQAVGNLVVNALRHTPRGTPIEVQVHRRDGRGLVRVRDHGSGLPEEALPRVFDRFWQADPARTGAGTGLGLSIVQAVAAEHGGTAMAENAPDGGAIFTFSLPADDGATGPVRVGDDAPVRRPEEITDAT